MSFLRFSPVTWFIFMLFLASAAAFFLLTEDRYTDFIRPALERDQKTPVPVQVRQAIVRESREVLRVESTASKPSVEALEHDGRKLEDAAVKRSEIEPPVSTPVEQPAPDAAGNLLSYSFTVTGKGFRAVFRTDSAVPDPKVFFLADPARWVVDIPGKWRNTARFNNRIEDGFISRVVLGEHEEYLRVVFHFRETGLTRTEPPDIINEKGGFVVFLPVS